MFSWVSDTIRVLLWGLVNGILFLMDTCYLLINSLLSIDITSSEIILRAWQGLAAFIGIFVLVRVISRIIKIHFDDESLEKFNILEIAIRLCTISIVAISFPLIISAINLVGTTFTTNTALILGVSSDNLPSTTIISAYVSSETGNDLIYTLDQIDVTEKLDSGAYKFFDGYSSIFIIGIIGFGAGILMIVIGLSVAKRIFELGMLILVAPFPISSFVFKDGDLSGTWLKSFMSVYFCNFFQIAILQIVMSVSSSAQIRSYGSFLQIIVLIGGLLFCLSGSETLAKFIGADTSASNTLQQVASLRMASAGLGGMLRNTAGGAFSAFKAAGAGTIVGTGMILGGKSISKMGGAAGIADSLKNGNLSTPGSKAHLAGISADMSNSRLGNFAVNGARHMYANSAQHIASKPSYQKMSNFKNNMKEFQKPKLGGQNGSNNT